MRFPVTFLFSPWLFYLADLTNPRHHILRAGQSNGITQGPVPGAVADRLSLAPVGRPVIRQALQALTFQRRQVSDTSLFSPVFSFIPEAEAICAAGKKCGKRLIWPSKAGKELGFVFFFDRSTHLPLLHGKNDGYAPPCFFRKYSTFSGGRQPRLAAYLRIREHWAALK